MQNTAPADPLRVGNMGLMLTEPGVCSACNFRENGNDGVFCGQGYDEVDGALVCKESVCVPAYITFVKSSTGDLRVSKLWIAQGEVKTQVKENFPDFLAEDYADIESAMVRLQEVCLDQAENWEASLAKDLNVWVSFLE